MFSLSEILTIWISSEKERRRAMEEKNRLNETLLRDAAELEMLYESVKGAQIHSEELEEAVNWALLI